MHILILSKRNAQAQNRLVRAAEALAAYFELDSALVDGLKPNEKDKDVRGLKQREGVAALVEALALKVGAVEEPAPDAQREGDVTAVTEPEGAAPPEEPAPENAPGEELPPPVLDEDGVQSQAVKDELGMAPHTEDEFVTVPAEKSPAEKAPFEELADEIKDSPAEEEPVEEALEKKPAPKSTTKKSSKKKK